MLVTHLAGKHFKTDKHYRKNQHLHITNDQPLLTESIYKQ